MIAWWNKLLFLRSDAYLHYVFFYSNWLKFNVQYNNNLKIKAKISTPEKTQESEIIIPKLQVNSWQLVTIPIGISELNKEDINNIYLEFLGNINVSIIDFRIIPTLEQDVKIYGINLSKSNQITYIDYNGVTKNINVFDGINFINISDIFKTYRNYYKNPLRFDLILNNGQARFDVKKSVNYIFRSNKRN